VDYYIRSAESKTNRKPNRAKRMDCAQLAAALGTHDNLDRSYDPDCRAAKESPFYEVSGSKGRLFPCRISRALPIYS
jgi:hypothetical protein